VPTFGVDPAWPKRLRPTVLGARAVPGSTPTSSSRRLGQMNFLVGETSEGKGVQKSCREEWETRVKPIVR
jgi:hypothetical protein